MFEFKLADVGEGMHEAEILRWLVEPGAAVKVDQPIVEIQTDKAVVELPSPVAGKVQKINTAVGQMAHVGDVLIVFDTAVSAVGSVKAGEAAPSPIPAVSRPPVATGGSLDPSKSKPAQAVVPSFDALPPTVLSSQPVVPNLAVAQMSAAGEANGVVIRKPGSVRAAPAVRKRAVELGVDLALVTPGSSDGRVLLKDVEEYAANGGANSPAGADEGLLTLIQAKPGWNDPAMVAHTAVEAPAVSNGNGNGHGPGTLTARPNLAPGGEERKPLAGLRRRIAERMELSARTIPQVTTFDEADATELVALRGRLQEASLKRGVKMTYLPLIVKAVVQTLKSFPMFNASLDEASREVVYKHYYHIGLATATPDGLLVPVVRDADRLSLVALAGEINRLGEGGRKRSLKAFELSGSTFTLSNVGSFGGYTGTAIINPPEAAILAVGRVQERAVVRGGLVVARPILPLSLSFDHRLIDGAEAGYFVTALKELLENPSLMMLEAV